MQLCDFYRTKHELNNKTKDLQDKLAKIQTQNKAITDINFKF